MKFARVPQGTSVANQPILWLSWESAALAGARSLIPHSSLGGPSFRRRSCFSTALTAPRAIRRPTPRAHLVAGTANRTASPPTTAVTLAAFITPAPVAAPAIAGGAGEAVEGARSWVQEGLPFELSHRTGGYRWSKH